MFHLSDSVGIISWNATPGKACGATLGDICNTSEVRGRRPDLCHLLSSPPPSHHLFPLFSSAVLPFLSPLHRCTSRCWRHRHCTGKLLVGPLMMSNSYARCYGAIFCCRSNHASDVCVWFFFSLTCCRLNRKPAGCRGCAEQGQCFTQLCRWTSTEILKTALSVSAGVALAHLTAHLPANYYRWHKPAQRSFKNQ